MLLSPAGIPAKNNKVELPALLILRVNKEGKVDVSHYGSGYRRLGQR